MPSPQPCAGSWHVEQALPVSPESRVSKNSVRPSSASGAFTSGAGGSGAKTRTSCADVGQIPTIASKMKLAPKAPSVPDVSACAPTTGTGHCCHRLSLEAAITPTAVPGCCFDLSQIIVERLISSVIARTLHRAGYDPLWMNGERDAHCGSGPSLLTNGHWQIDQCNTGCRRSTDAGLFKIV